MKKHYGHTALLALVFTVGAAHAEATQVRDPISMREQRAQISRKFSAFVAKGDLIAARRFMEENKLIEKRIVSRSRAASLYYEMEEYTLALEQVNSDIAELKERNISPFPQSLLSWKLMTESAKNGVAPDWTTLPNESELKNPGYFVRSMAHTAIVEFHFRTAEFLMKELPKLGVDPERVKELTKLLEEKRLEQKKLQEADKVKPASDPKPGA
jgi:hypothetical protein